MTLRFFSQRRLRRPPVLICLLQQTTLPPERLNRHSLKWGGALGRFGRRRRQVRACARCECPAEASSARSPILNTPRIVASIGGMSQHVGVDKGPTRAALISFSISAGVTYSPGRRSASAGRVGTDRYVFGVAGRSGAGIGVFSIPYPRLTGRRSFPVDRKGKSP